MSPKRTEAAVDAAVAKLLKRRGAYTVKVRGTPIGRRGVPDRLVCYRGRFLAVEEKRPGGSPTKLQEHELDRVRDAGGVALVAEDESEVELALDRIDSELDGT